MIIQAELRRKQSEYEGEACSVDKVIELPAQRFQQFSRALLADYDFIAENKTAIRHDTDSRHCLLILNANGTDGFLVDPQGYNYARYSAFVPNARSLLTSDMEIDHSYISPAEPWRDENRDEMLRMTLHVNGKPDYFEKENINSMDESTELMLTMMGAFAQAESESISSNIQAGKRYAMQRGEATINYHNLYAYEKGPDGKPRIIPEQAEVVKEIYAHYLRGDSLLMICRYLEAQHIPNIRGGTTWGHSAVRGILSNEKYVGDVLMQKTFRQDCISHKAIRNTGQRPMYLVQNNHEAIIDRKTYDAVQTELARRTAIKGTTEKSTPSGRSSYMPMYALSERVFCGECGTRYRRCTWVNKGKKHIVWRCVSRIDYGKKYCHTSPSVDEQQLQQAILRAINSVMSDKPTLVRQVTENLQVVIHPSRSGELTIAEIDHQLETLAQEFDTVFTTVTSGNSADYIEHFKVIFAQQAELKAKRAELKQQQTEDAELTSHMEQATDTLGQAGTAITEWDEYQIRALVESVRILSKDEILVRLKSGIEVKEHLV